MATDWWSFIAPSTHLRITSHSTCSFSSVFAYSKETMITLLLNFVTLSIHLASSKTSVGPLMQPAICMILFYHVLLANCGLITQLKTLKSLVTLQYFPTCSSQNFLMSKRPSNSVKVTRNDPQYFTRDQDLYNFCLTLLPAYNNGCNGAMTTLMVLNKKLISYHTWYDKNRYSTQPSTL